MLLIAARTISQSLGCLRDVWVVTFSAASVLFMMKVITSWKHALKLFSSWTACKNYGRQLKPLVFSRNEIVMSKYAWH